MQRLLHDELVTALEALEEFFGQLTPAAGTTAAWSVAAAAAGLRAGKVYVVEGGHSGRGELGIRCVEHSNGLFSY